MFGASIGELHVDIYDGAWNNSVWSIIGEQQTANGDAYKQGNVDLSAYENRNGIKVRFRGITGVDWRGDITIDNVSVCAINPGVAAISTSTMCAAATVDLTLTGKEGGATVQWQQSTDNLVFTNIGRATADAHITGVLATGSSYYYRAAVTSGCTNYSNVVSVAVTAGAGTINTFPYSEDFEGGIGSWGNPGGDDFDWTRDQAGTPSVGTGPADGNDGSTWYVYTEASNPNNPTKTAFFEASFDFTGIVNPELVFYYHIFGTNSGNLYVDVGAETAVWSISGPQQAADTDDYIKATVDLTAYANRCNVTIRFRGVTGVNWSSDIAIDDIAVRNACLSVNGGAASISDNIHCAASAVDLSVIGQDGGATLQWQQSTDNITFANLAGATSPNFTTAVLPTGFTYYHRVAVTSGCVRYSDTVSVTVNSGGGVSAFPYLEDFEAGTGIWVQGVGDDFDWTRDQAGTPSGGTGPATGNASTWYMFTEASGANSPSKTTYYEAGFDFTAETTPTLGFFYHMFGANMGALYIDINGVNIWSLSGTQQTASGDAWREQGLDLSVYAGICNVKIRFRAVTGTGLSSDIAIDDISICSVNAGDATISDGSLCAAGTVDLTLASYQPGSTFQWQQSTDNITFANLAGKTSDIETTAALALGSTYYFRCAVTNGCTNYSNTVSVNVSAGGGIAVFPYSESFEAGLGAWSGAAGDDFDWSRTSGTTPSGSTGPSGAADANFYMFTEASGANFPAKTAYFQAEFDFTGQANPQITFSYHMNGVSMGNLYLDINGVNVWSKTGSQQGGFGDPWATAEVDLSAYSNECSIIIRFRGETGTNFYSDMCIDDINVCIKPTTSVIVGSADVCKNTLGEDYSVSNNAGNTYSWILTGGVQAAGGTTNAITVDWGATGMAGSVKVTETSGACMGDQKSSAVNVHTLPTSSIVGNSAVAETAAGENYSVTNRAGYTYTWLVTGGAITAGQGSSTITVTWGAAGAGNVNVIATSGVPSPVCAAVTGVDLVTSIYNIIKSANDGNWNVAATWDCVCIPTAVNSLTILNTHDVTLTADRTIANLTVDAGGSINNGGNILTITEDYTMNGTHSGTGVTRLTGTGSNISGTGNTSNSSNLEIRTGSKTILSSTVFNKPNGNIDIVDASIIITNNGSVTIANDITGLNGTDHWINATNSSLTIGGNLLTTGQLTSSATGNTVTYNGAGAQNIKLPNASQYNTLTISNRSVSSLTGNIIVDVDLNISGTAQLDASASNYDIELSGNWTNTSGNANPFVERNATVGFKGTGSQTITYTSDETFYDVVLNKTSGSLILGTNTNVTIGNLLTLTNGIITPTTLEMVIFITGSSASSNSTSYIAGRVQKTGATDFIFPIGKGGKYARLAISSISASSTFQGEYYNAAYANTSAVGTLNNVSVKEYWDLNRVAGGNCNATLYWEDGNFSGIQDISGTDLVVTHWNSGLSVWEDKGGSYTGLAAAGTVTSGLLTSFSPFGFGSVAGDNTLPIELLSFNAILEDGAVALDWTTATEINNDYFTVQRAIDQAYFDDILELQGAGNSLVTKKYYAFDTEPLNGISYYRLKQTDYDGKTSYSSIETVTRASKNQNYLLFPNPVENRQFSIAIQSETHQSVLLVLYNTLGKQVYSKAFVQKVGNSLIAVNLSKELAPGIYFVIGTSDKELFKKRILIR